MTTTLPNLATTPVDVLFRAICDIPSVSGDEAAIADAIQTSLATYPHLEVLRDGDTVVARTHLGRASRVVIAGHIDTVPIQGNLPTWTTQDPAEGEIVWGRGTVDMKGGVAAALQRAATVTEPIVDVTYVFYDNEEVEAAKNGLGRVAANHPDWLTADFAILGEPTAAHIEGGCNGTMRVDVSTKGLTALLAPGAVTMRSTILHRSWRRSRPTRARRSPWTGLPTARVSTPSGFAAESPET